MPAGRRARSRWPAAQGMAGASSVVASAQVSRHASGSGWPHVAAATARHSAWRQVTPRPPPACGLRRRAGGAAQRRPPLRWPRSQGGTPTAWSVHLATFFVHVPCVRRVARGWQDAGVRGKGWGATRVRARARGGVWFEVARAAVSRSGQAPRSSSFSAWFGPKNRMFGGSLQAWNKTKPTQTFSSCGSKSHGKREELL